jgi:hypothetical protein
MKVCFLKICLILLFSTGCFKHDHDHDHHSHDHKHYHQSNIGVDDPKLGIVIVSDRQALGPHVHGEMNLSIVVENGVLAFQLQGSADGMLGYEHAPRTDEEKQAWGELRSYWSRDRLLDIFRFNRHLDCHVHEHQTQLILPEQGHGNIDIAGKIMCEKRISDVVLTLEFLSAFPRLRKLQVEALPQDNKSPINRKFSSAEMINIDL